MSCLMQPECTRFEWEWECDWPGAGRVPRVVRLASPGRPTLRSLKHGFYSFDTSPGTDVHFVASDHAYYNADTPVEDYNRLRVPWGEPDRYDVEGSAVKVFEAGGNRWSTCMGAVPGTPCEATPTPTADPSPTPTPTPCLTCDPPARQVKSRGLWPTPQPWIVDVSDIDNIQDAARRERFQNAVATSVALINAAAQIPILETSTGPGQLTFYARTLCEAEEAGLPDLTADGQIDGLYLWRTGDSVCPGPYLRPGAQLYVREADTASLRFATFIPCAWRDAIVFEWSELELRNLVMHELVHAVITIGHPSGQGADYLCQPVVQSRNCPGVLNVGPPHLFAADVAALECLYEYRRP